MNEELVFFVNGCKIVEKQPDPETTLLHYLRDRLRLTGSKQGCGEGGCGACTVMVSGYNMVNDTISHYSVNACLFPLCSLHGLAVTTVEGIGSTRTKLHPVQEQLAKSHGTQCGFCTPGIVMSMYTLLRTNQLPTREEIENNLDGNLCRCTGYRPILQGFSAFAKDTCGMGGKCCKLKSNCESGIYDVRGSENNVREGSTHVSYDLSQEPIFPPDLKIYAERYQTSLQFRTKRVTWYRPVDLEELLNLKSTYPNAKLVAGNTEVGIERKLKHMLHPVLIAVTHIPQLNSTECSDTAITVGASVSLTTMKNVLMDRINIFPEYKTRTFKIFVDMLDRFAGHQIRNVASIGGNIMTASPISDLNPLLVAAGAKLTIGRKGKSSRILLITDDFFKSYRKTSLEPDEVLLAVTIPTSDKNEHFSVFKQAHRKDDDISIVNAGMRVKFMEASDIVEDICLVYGGMAQTTVVAKKTMMSLKHHKWNDELLKTACSLLGSDLPLPRGSPGGMEEYRQTLSVSFFFKFFLEVRDKLLQQVSTIQESRPSVSDAVGDVERGVSGGAQVFEDVTDDQDLQDAVGRPLVHISALQQTTGEAIFVDDVPKIHGELYAALVLSTKAHAKISCVDASEALCMPGIVGFFTYKDIPGQTVFSVVEGDAQEIFASEEVLHQGQVIGCIVGESQIEAQRAAKQVSVKYDELKPILTIEEAIEENSFFKPIYNLLVENGDIGKGFKESDHVIHGEVRIGPQQHFYMETPAVVARPTYEDGGMEIISNTQFPSGLQHHVASTLGVQENKIVTRVKRIGGGFGGKESNPILVTLPVAVAAHRLNRPVRCMLEREEDAVMSGGRHPFLAKYKLGFSTTGLIKALDLHLYSNSGSRLDMSESVMIKAVHSCDNAYNIPNIRVRGTLCKTNIPSPTAFRGFGAPQAMFVTETMADRISDVLNKAQHEVRKVNLYHEGNLTYYGQVVEGANIRMLWQECITQSEYMTRRHQVEHFNSNHRWKKRGIAIIPTKFGLSYPAPEKHLTQACALVTAYMDGSVLIAHSGVEMGQGLHTKMIQNGHTPDLRQEIGWCQNEGTENNGEKENFIPRKQIRYFLTEGRAHSAPFLNFISQTVSKGTRDFIGFMKEVASRALRVPASQIHITDTCTDKIHRTCCTAGSLGSDLGGGAVKNACDILSARLEPIRKAFPHGTFKEWVNAAYKERVHLSAAGFYRTEGLDHDPQTNRGNFYHYFTCGVACTEVEIDCLTGDHQVLRTDIVMDVGKSLNPGIDIGQIEGAFMMGYGLFILEQSKTNAEGTVLTRGPGTYKIPSFRNIPVQLNVSLLKDSANSKVVYSSKGIGEPPLFLASSAFFAVKNAIRSARKDSGNSQEFRLDSPATPEKIRMACVDQFTEQFTSRRKGTVTLWYIEL